MASSLSEAANLAWNAYGRAEREGTYYLASHITSVAQVLPEPGESF